MNEPGGGAITRLSICEIIVACACIARPELPQTQVLVLSKIFLYRALNIGIVAQRCVKIKRTLVDEPFRSECGHEFHRVNRTTVLQRSADVQIFLGHIFLDLTTLFTSHGREPIE